MCKNTIYSRLIRAGAALDHHASDLYVLVDSFSRDLLADAKREGHDVTYFTSQRDGARWEVRPAILRPAMSRAPVIDIKLGRFKASDTRGLPEIGR